MTTDGNFIWYELCTAEPQTVAAFYQALLGWDRRDYPGSEPPYHVMTVGGAGVAGITSSSGADDIGWTGYVMASDVDAKAEEVKSLGGSITSGPVDMEGVGRMAVAKDRHGVRFVLFNPAPMDTPPRPDPMTIGMPAWNELHGGNLDADFAFYSKLFGWTKGDGMDMGPMGIYQQFMAGGPAIGGMMTKVPQMPKPSWLYYFVSEPSGAAATKVADLGGTVIFGPQEVPGPMWILQCLDPQQNLFGLVSVTP